MNKHLITISFILIALLQLRANDAYLGSRGGNVFPIIRNENVRMVKEEIRVIMEKDSCRVYCKFWFKNSGLKGEYVLMGFPDYFINIAQNSEPIRDFTCKVNGVDTEINKRTQTIEIDKIPELKEYERWFCWSLEIKPNEMVLVENTYTGNWGGSAEGTSSFSYLIGTAQTWSSTIASGRVVFDYSKVASKLFLDTLRHSHSSLSKEISRTIYNDSTVFTFNNYRPKWDETLTVEIYRFWSCPYGEIKEELLEYPYRPLSFKSKSKLTLRLMRNEVYARHGYVFNDEKLLQYFSAQSWYKPNKSFDPQQLNSFEKLFVKYIQNLENR